jgi:HD superfamily phosphodiesterase
MGEMTRDLHETTRDLDDVDAWARTAPAVPDEWFLEPDRAYGIHGAGHIRRVHILADRLTRELGWDAEARRRVLTAALWHDIGRTHDGWEPGHGRRSVERAVELGLDESLENDDDRAVVLFAILCHSDEDEEASAALEALSADLREAAVQALRLLKDADALDRVRLGYYDLDPRRLRFDCSHELISFANALYRYTRRRGR